MVASPGILWTLAGVVVGFCFLDCLHYRLRRAVSCRRMRSCCDILQKSWWGDAMRRMAFVVVVGSTLSALAWPVAAHAQQGGSLVLTVLAGCPSGAASCVPVMNAAIGSFPAGAQRNAELVTVSANLAEIARRPQTPISTCLDIAEAIRLAGRAVTDPANSQALLLLAESLCTSGLQTAATGETNSGPSASLVGGSTGDAPAPPPPSPPPEVPPPPSETPPETPPDEPDGGGSDNDEDVYDTPDDTPPT